MTTPCEDIAAPPSVWPDEGDKPSVDLARTGPSSTGGHERVEALAAPAIGDSALSTDVDAGADAEFVRDAADLARLINRESVWLPFALSSGHGLQPAAVLRYVAAFDRSDNVTGILRWNSKAISKRCGLPVSRVPVGTLLEAYKKADLLIDVTPRVGGCYQVQFPRSGKTLRLPLGACWTHRWKASSPVGPRYGRHTAHVLRWLLAIMKTGDWGEHGLTVATSLPARTIADRAGLAYSTYRRYWATVQQVCADDDWIQWEQTYRDDLGADAYAITLDWRRVPMLIAVSDQAASDSEQGGVSDSEQGSPCSGEQGDRRIVGTLFKETNPLSQCSSFSPSSSNLAPASQTFGTARRAAMPSTQEEKGTARAEVTRTGMASASGIPVDLQLAAAGTCPRSAASDRDDHTTTGYEAWVLTVIAGIAAPANPRRLPLSLSDAEGLCQRLRAAYEAGWMPAPLVAALTRQDPDVRSVGGALQYRIANLPARANSDAPVVHSRRALEDERAYTAAASSRSADAYTQLTM